MIDHASQEIETHAQPKYYHYHHPLTQRQRTPPPKTMTKAHSPSRRHTRRLCIIVRRLTHSPSLTSSTHPKSAPCVSQTHHFQMNFYLHMHLIFNSPLPHLPPAAVASSNSFATVASTTHPCSSSPHTKGGS